MIFFSSIADQHHVDTFRASHRFGERQELLTDRACRRGEEQHGFMPCRIFATDLPLLALDVDDAERRSLVTNARPVVRYHRPQWRGSLMQKPNLPGYSKKNDSSSAQSDPLKDAGRN